MPIPTFGHPALPIMLAGLIDGRIKPRHPWLVSQSLKLTQSGIIVHRDSHMNLC
jgi:hypothetical protein